MLWWQKAGKVSSNRGVVLASGELRAAVAIDQQMSGRWVTSVLSSLDVEWVSHHLKAGESRMAGLQIASEAIDSYPTELAGLLGEAFSTQVQ